jgi:hypothetical protein
VATSDRYAENNPTWNPTNPDPDPQTEGSSLQDQLEIETDEVLEEADRGWSIAVVAPMWWSLSDVVERVAGTSLFVLVLLGGGSQVFWVRGSEVGVVLLTLAGTFAAVVAALWCLQVLLQRRVYGRRRSRSDRRSAARERVLKRWSKDAPRDARQQ